MGESKNRRQQVFVNQPLQRRVILASIWIPCMCLVLSATGLAVFSTRLHAEAMLLNEDLPSTLPVLLASIGFVFVAAGFTIVHGIRLSQRIAGPSVNFHHTLSQIKQGDLSARVRLRKLDLLADTADHVNEFLDWLEEHPPSGVTRPEEAQTEDAEQETAAATEAAD